MMKEKVLYMKELRGKGVCKFRNTVTFTCRRVLEREDERKGLCMEIVGEDRQVK